MRIGCKELFFFWGKHIAKNWTVYHLHHLHREENHYAYYLLAKECCRLAKTFVVFSVPTFVQSQLEVDVYAV